MSNRITTTPSNIARLATLTLGALLLSIDAGAQSLRVTGSNSSNNDIYDVFFAPPSVTVLNEDQPSRSNISSLHFQPDIAGTRVDLLATDINRAELLLYRGAAGVGEVIWDTTMGAGPAGGPDGLSTDSRRNVYVTSSAPSGTVPSELWVFPGNPTKCVVEPILVDANFDVVGGQPVNQFADTTVSDRVLSDEIGVDDLLVLSADPPQLFVYSAEALATVLVTCNPIDPARVLLDMYKFPPPPVKAAGIAIWPDDDTLLVTTTAGEILNFDASGGVLGLFASGLGTGSQRKIKAGIENSIPTAYVADRSRGEILKFQRPPENEFADLVGSVKDGVENPNGIALTNAAAVLAEECTKGDGCNIIGLITHLVNTAVGGSVIEDVCVAVDPRVTAPGVCTGTLLIPNDVCPGFAPTEIPDHLCGASGLGGDELAIVQTNASVTITAGQVLNTADAKAVFGGNVPTCEEGASLGWGTTGPPFPVEGNQVIEMTSACSNPSQGLTKGFSHFVFGVALNLNAFSGTEPIDKLQSFAIDKFDNFLAMIDESPPDSRKAKRQLERCVAGARRETVRGRFDKAISKLNSCNLEGALKSDPDINPNPTGEAKGRRANLLYLLVDRISLLP